MGPETAKCEMPASDMRRAWCIDTIIEIAASYHGVSPHEVRSRVRERAVVAARVEVWRELRNRGWSYPRIGKEFGRDHTTVLVTLRRHYGREIESHG